MSVCVSVCRVGQVSLATPKSHARTVALGMVDAGMGSATVTPATRARLAARSKSAEKDA